MKEPEKKLRIFVAIEAPREWKEKLGHIQAQIKPIFDQADVKWVRPEQMHITLRFLGYVVPAETEQVKEVLRGACEGVSGFTVTYAGIGSFPHARKPRVLWAGITDAGGTLTRLHERIKAATANLGEAPEERAFVAHLTLARITSISRGAAEKAAAEFPGLAKAITTPWPVGEVLLMQSHLSQAGPRYETLARVGLS